LANGLTASSAALPKPPMPDAAPMLAMLCVRATGHLLPPLSAVGGPARSVLVARLPKPPAPDPAPLLTLLCARVAGQSRGPRAGS